jgi:hypothetical protein
MLLPAPCRLAVHPPNRRSCRGDGAMIAPRITGSRPVIGATRRLTVNFGNVSPSYSSQPLQTARRDPAPPRGRTVPHPPVPSRHDRLRAGITRVRLTTHEAQPRPGRDHTASGSRHDSIPRRGHGAAHILTAAKSHFSHRAAALDPVRLFRDGARPPINRMPQLCKFFNAMRRFCGCASSQLVLQQGKRISHKTLRFHDFFDGHGTNPNDKRG